MLGTCTLHPVRQQHHKPAETLPFVFSTDDELIDDDLCHVGKVTELCLPADESIRRVETVSVLVAQDTRFAQATVVQLDRSLCSRQICQRDVLLAILDVVQNCMAMTERTSFHVLAMNSNTESFQRDRGELRRGDEIISLSEREREMLRLLAENPGEPVSREALAGESSMSSERTIDMQITRLRRKIEMDSSNPVYLQTARGAGYRLVIDR